MCAMQPCAPRVATHDKGTPGSRYHKGTRGMHNLIETFVSAITRQESPMADCESGGGRRVYTRACARARRRSSAKPSSAKPPIT